MIVEQKSTNSKTRANCRQNAIHFVGSLFFRRETTISLNMVLYACISPVSVLLLLRVVPPFRAIRRLQSILSNVYLVIQVTHSLMDISQYHKSPLNVSTSVTLDPKCETFFFRHIFAYCCQL